MDSNGDRNGIKNPEIEEQNACEGLLHKKISKTIKIY